MTTPEPPKPPERLTDEQLQARVREIVTEVLINRAERLAAAAPPAAASGWRRRPVVLGVVLAVLVAVAAGEALWKTGIFTLSTDAPDELVGVWKTSAPRYADRRLAISRSTIAFDAGEQGYFMAPITKITADRGPDSTLYVISYESGEDETAELAVYYASRGRGVIRFKNQRQLVWTRVP